jgi:hypothetical protein
MSNNESGVAQGEGTAEFPLDERRQGQDRRRLTLGTFLRGSLTPRRRTGRRSDDEYHVDWHEPELLFLSVTIVLLSVVDALLTLTLLTHGGREVNPFLEYVLTHYPTRFAVIKMGLTGAGVLIMVAVARARLFRLVRVKTILQWCLLGYLALIGYEMWLIGGIF